MEMLGENEIKSLAITILLKGGHKQLIKDLKLIKLANAPLFASDSIDETINSQEGVANSTS